MLMVGHKKWKRKKSNSEYSNAKYLQDILYNAWEMIGVVNDCDYDISRSTTFKNTLPGTVLSLQAI